MKLVEGAISSAENMYETWRGQPREASTGYAVVFLTPGKIWSNIGKVEVLSMLDLLQSVINVYTNC